MSDSIKINVLKYSPEYESLRPFLETLPERFAKGEGVVIHRGRNVLRQLEYEGHSYVVKSFHRPNLINRFVYGVLRASKARRSYQYAETFTKIGVGTPRPVAYIEMRSHLLFTDSYYVTCLSQCSHVYSDLFERKFDYEAAVLREVGRTTAILHEHGYAHKDYGRGNILFGKMPDGTVRVEIVDLNRMYIGPIDVKRGCKNLERLPATPEMHRLLAEEYAKVRGFDAEECYELMKGYRSKNTTPSDPY